MRTYIDQHNKKANRPQSKPLPLDDYIHHGQITTNNYSTHSQYKLN